MPNDIKSITGSESFRKRNPHLFGVGQLPVHQPEPDARGALVGKGAATQRCKGGVAVRVAGPLLTIELVRCGSRSLDSDNLASSFKGLRDSIAESLDVDDGDARLEWRYSQVKTTAKAGVIVKFDIML
jgi:hypothetical protein